MTRTPGTVAIPDPETQALCRLTPEVHVMRAALGAPTNCYQCRLDFDVDSPGCANHSAKADQWAACIACGDLVTRAACAADNGRRTWFHVREATDTFVGAGGLSIECHHPAPTPAPYLTEEQAGFIEAITKTFTPAQRAQATELYLRLPAERRDGFLNRCRFVWTIVRAVMDETVGGR
ncbi:gp78 [Rhodococcus phage ReqiPine5]|uniref:Gp78 n=1 Tax=Rhodococcus phage ReqiPine5 TaxID=691963 RepID=D4P853_9CAUD|nr:gp78 [Rhodococcus phage ReqiPine5]ADD81183.1 gp78 [Rhodococcus phage ReqiPine5]